MSVSCEMNLERRRVPKLAHAFDAYEIPLVYGPDINSNDQWTLTIITDPDEGHVTGATLYNKDRQVGSFYHSTMTKWELTLFDYYPGERLPTPSVIRLAALCFQAIVGPKQEVKYSLLPPHQISDD